MKVSTWACDVCGAQKKDVNRWWVMDMFPQGMTVRAWPEAKEVDSWQRHFCGIEHLQQEIGRQLQEILKAEQMSAVQDTQKTENA